MISYLGVCIFRYIPHDGVQYPQYPHFLAGNINSAKSEGGMLYIPKVRVDPSAPSSRSFGILIVCAQYGDDVAFI